MNNSPDPRPNTNQAATAEIFTEQTGKVCPLYNQDAPRQPWYATDLDNVPDGQPVITFHLGLDAAGNPAVISAVIPAKILRTPNIDAFSDPTHPFPGWADYVKAQPPTKSTFSFAPPFNTFPAQPINVQLLTSPTVAQRACQELIDAGFAASLVVVTQESGQVYNYDPNDPRRVYEIQIGANSWSLMEVLQQRFASGVWDPGTWSLDAVKGPQFTPETFPPMPRNTSTLPEPIDPKYADPNKWEAFSPLPGVIGIRPKGSAPADPTAILQGVATNVQEILTWVQKQPSAA